MGQHPAEKPQALRKEMHIHAEQVLPDSKWSNDSLRSIKTPTSPEPNDYASIQNIPSISMLALLSECKAVSVVNKFLEIWDHLYTEPIKMNRWR